MDTRGTERQVPRPRSNEARAIVVDPEARQRLPPSGQWSDDDYDVLADGEIVFRHACKLGLEGIVSKRKDSVYRSGRSSDWLKMKNPACTAVTREAGRMGEMIAPTCGATDRSRLATRAEFILAVFCEGGPATQGCAPVYWFKKIFRSC